MSQIFNRHTNIYSRLSILALVGFVAVLGGVVALINVSGYNTNQDTYVDQPIHPSQIRVGDIVTFQDPEQTRTITHRVRRIDISEGQAHVITRGDANDTVEKWQIPVNGKVGRVEYQVPKIGYPVTWSHTRDGRLAMVSLPALLLTIMALVKIWRSDEKGDPGEGELAHADA